MKNLLLMILTLLLVGGCCTPKGQWEANQVAMYRPKAAERNEYIHASMFPRTASRCMFFETRINAKDPLIRERVLIVVGYFYSLPDDDYVAFLKRMTYDSDPLVRGRAIKKLYSMWVPQDPESLPLVFAGYHKDQMIDRAEESTLQNLIQHCEHGGLGGGYAAYVLGLLKMEEAIPALQELTNDPNIFVRFTAARALLDCGDRETAVAVFDIMSSQQLELYASIASLNAEERRDIRNQIHPFYATNACRGLIEVGGEEEREGYMRMIKLFEYFEDSEDINDQSHIHDIRGILAVKSGIYFDTSNEAAVWLKKSKLKKI